MPNWAGMSKTAPDYRFLAIREPLSELDLGDAEQLPFPTMSFPTLGRYKLFGLVTNRALAGDELIRWQRERCGKSEEAHAVIKDDLAGGRLPSGLFGANAAWWAIMVLAHNLNAMMKRLVQGGDWAARRMKAMRFHLIALPGRVVRHARRLIVRLSADALDLIRDARAVILPCNRHRADDRPASSARPANAAGLGRPRRSRDRRIGAGLVNDAGGRSPTTIARACSPRTRLDPRPRPKSARSTARFARAHELDAGSWICKYLDKLEIGGIIPTWFRMTRCEGDQP